MEIIGQMAGAAFTLFGQSGCGGTEMLGLIRAPSMPESTGAFLFENHWLYWVVGLALGLTLAYRGRTMPSKGMARAGVAIAVLSVLWACAALVVDTPAERLYAAHKGMAAAAAKGDVEALMGYLANDFTCPQLGIEDVKNSRDALEAALKTNGVKGSTITGYRTRVNHHVAQVMVTLITETNLGMVKTSWQLVWADIPGQDWRIRQADLQTINDEPVNSGFRIPEQGGSGG
jgi:hypothetical protein